MSETQNNDIKKRIIENFIDTEQVIADKLKDPDFNKIILTKNYGYIALRLTGTGITERENKENWDRDLEVFSSEKLMHRYANINVCFSHPKNDDGELVELGFDSADMIIGNTIDSFLRDSEIWVIARIFNLKALDFLAQYDLSTSPHFISGSVKDEDGVLIEKPLIINHLAIVASGYWDQFTDNAPIASSDGVHLVKEVKMADSDLTKQSDTSLETATTSTPEPTPKADADTTADDNQLVEVATTTAQSEEEKAVMEMQEEVAKLKENELQEANSFEELAENHEKLSDNDNEEEKVEEEKIEKEEKVEEKIDQAEDPTPKADADSKGEEVIEKKEEIIEPQAQGGIVNDVVKDIVVDKLIQEASWTDDDDKRDEIIREVAHLVDQAKSKGIALVRPHYGVERLTPSETIKKFLVANSDQVADHHKSLVNHIDSSSLEFGMEVFDTIKQKVKNAKVEGIVEDSLIRYPDGKIQLKI